LDGVCVCRRFRSVDIQNKVARTIFRVDAIVFVPELFFVVGARRRAFDFQKAVAFGYVQRRNAELVSQVD
jgi:hypothetical protein